MAGATLSHITTDAPSSPFFVACSGCVGSWISGRGCQLCQLNGFPSGAVMRKWLPCCSRHPHPPRVRFFELQARAGWNTESNTKHDCIEARIVVITPGIPSVWDFFPRLGNCGSLPRHINILRTCCSQRVHPCCGRPAWVGS